ncbi:hypothetical protein EDD18DRAFT_1343302 [Armillaria luteobubalina]|uniref:Uncharacterized protein n=1 Tax=Armillaria luteobubalina TaxID=153913 RepID=A0AA39QKB2_9AGAR|nr:hypothetical protein EDD18DRAFT_1343302 [Armillaria luteobubalina]
MAEATDNSFVFANSLMGLQYFCLSMERFQFAYGWLTQWTKTLVYALQVRGEIPKTVAMPSITNKPGVNPWKITYHPVPVHVNQMEMLRTQVNNSARRFQELRDFINDFTIPKFSIRLPITLLRKITMQNLASRARALLSLQPVTTCEAEQLDHMITAKVHNLLGFPFWPLTDILTLPIAAMGFEFPSITRINLGIAINSVARDLNHHVPAYKAMAHITLADWTSTAGTLDVKTITAAVSGPISLAVLVTGKNNSILHSELMGLIMDHVLSQSWQGTQKLFSDHLNSVRITQDSKATGGNEAKLQHIPARSYYRWIVDIQTSSPHISLEYTPGHSCQRTMPATLNDEADHFASWAQKHRNQLPVALIPTFFMDEFTFWTPDNGWIESEIKSFINSSMVKAKVQELAIGRHQ